METLWYAILAVMLVAYAVLDGFDFGAGIVHLFVARTDEERRDVLAAIGPVWDGNEVWLIASGGVLVFAFPRAYAASFSGLYLPLMIVLWLLVLRGVSIEFRSKLENPLWRAGWDATFSMASAAMAIVLGVAIGNLVRGVPLDDSGFFEEDLFAVDGSRAGAIDAYTALLGVFSLATLGAHGATYLAFKTSDALQERSRAAASRLWQIVIGLGVAATIATAWLERPFFASFLRRPVLWPLPVVAFACALVALAALRRGRDLLAFLASSGLIVAMLLATAGTLFPVILRSTLSAAFTIDAFGAAASPRSLARGLFVWIPAMALAVAYFVFLYREFRGKVGAAERHY